MLIAVAIFGCFVLCLIVFGGGQVYVPLFKSLWNIMNQYNSKSVVTGEQMDNIIASATSTPGVMGTKLSFITGYLSANGEWWGFFIAIITYLVFVVPAIIMVIFAYKYLNKVKSSESLKKILIYMKPIIVGSILALCIDLLISSALPFVYFNAYGRYAGLQKDGYKNEFLKEWRLIVLYFYVPVSIIVNFWMTGRKISPLVLVLINIATCLVVFQPWL